MRIDLVFEKLLHLNLRLTIVGAASCHLFVLIKYLQTGSKVFHVIKAFANTVACFPGS